MSETREQAIERLKENLLPFFSLSLTDQKLFEELGKSVCIVLEECGEWGPAFECEDFNQGNIYRIRPDYQPEPPKPKTVNLPIKLSDGWLGCCQHNLGVFDGTMLPFYFTHLHLLPSLPGFRGFSNKGGIQLPISIDAVAKEVTDGHEVVARFEVKGSD